MVSDRPVLVTGASGFVGSAVVARLLADGYRVRGTTRDPLAPTSKGIMYLPGAEEGLELVTADLGGSGMDEAVRGCGCVMHVASPYILNTADPRRDLVDPAVNGTIAVLEAAARAGDVHRVVLTSSFAAVAGEGRDEPFTEEDWNTGASLDHSPYYYSKVVAERAAWDFMERERPGFDLVVLNPTTVLGPTLIGRVNQSHEWFVGMTDGSHPAVIPLEFPMVDVRDVALAHVRAMERPVSGRHILSSGSFSPHRIYEVAVELGLTDRYRFPFFRLSGPFGVWLTRLFALTQPSGSRSFLRDSLGRRFVVDTSKSRHDLGIEYRPVEQTIGDTWIDLERHGLLGRR